MSGLLWSKENCQIVIDAFNAGDTYNDIAIKFKTSRNAIGGLINRIRERDPKALPRITPQEFSERIAKSKPQANQMPRAPYKPRKAGKLTPPMIAYGKGNTLNDSLYDGCEPTSFIDLEAHQCKFGIDSPPAGQMSQMMCCGAKREGSSSYCQHHIDLTTRTMRK
tara:strand:+ start:9867 stop:10361 length:495 start_codon:yes stop_codon:yes gene_type:complete